MPVDAFVPVTLCVAGLDPSGGAGLSLDVGIIRSLGLHALPVSTGVAIQNSERVFRVVPTEAQVVREQLDLVEQEFSLGAVKIGMVGSARTAEVLGAWLSQRPRLPMVLDPVLRASSGGPLGENIRSALRGELLPRATVVTPNLDEASALAGCPVTDRESMERAAEALRELGAAWALIKGGHLERGEAADYLEGPQARSWLSRPRHPYRDVRGTGCALSSVLAAGLSRGDSVEEAAAYAKDWVERAIARSFPAGKTRVLGFG